MNRLTALCIACFMILVAAVLAAFVVPFISFQTPMFGIPLLVPSLALLIVALAIIARATRPKHKMRPKYQ